MDTWNGFLAFDPDTGKPKDFSPYLEGQAVWLLCPPGSRLEGSPSTARFIRERFPKMGDSWYEWEGYEIDLTAISELHLCGPESTKTLTTSLAAKGNLARLVGGTRLQVSEHQVPLFVGSPPRLWVALPRCIETANCLQEWWIDLYHERDSEPRRNLSILMADLVDSLDWVDDGVEILLDHPNLLGAAPFGHYGITVHAPHGGEARLRLKIVPRFEMEKRERLYIPDKEAGAAPAIFQITIDGASRLMCCESSTDLHLESEATIGERHYWVTVPANCISVPLEVCREVSADREIRVSVSISVPRLRWLLQLQREIGDRTWRDRAIPISLEELEQSDLPQVILDVPGTHASSKVSLRISDQQGNEIQQIRGKALKNPRFHSFDLRAVKDTLQDSASSEFEAQLAIKGLPDLEDVALPILRIRRGIHLDQFLVQPEWQSGKSRLELCWRPDIRLRWRQVRFWSMTRPWTPPVVLSIPDNVRRKYIFDLDASELPIGSYLVEFVVYDPWLADTTPERPSVNDERVHWVHLGDLEQRRIDLERAGSTLDADFDTLCELFFLYRLLDYGDKAEGTLQRCCERLAAASLEQMLALFAALSKHPTAKAISCKLFAREQVESVIRAYEDGQLDPGTWQSYLMACPALDTLSPETLQALMRAPDAYIAHTAARELVARRDPRGIEVALSWFDKGRISRDDLLYLLTRSPKVAIETLRRRPLDRVVLELLRGLAEESPESIELIEVGYWVRCQAGWGKITEIVSAEGRAIPYIWRDRLSTCQLHVTLRSEHEPERIVIDMNRGVLSFSNLRGNLYACPKCRHFTTSDSNLLYSKHNRAAHGGIGASLLILSSPSSKQSKPLQFRATPPENVWE